MKLGITKILTLTLLSLFLCISSFAQTKIAVIDSRAFDVEEQGITKLVVANRQLDEEFAPSQKELKSLNERLWKFAAQIDRYSRINFPESFIKQNKEKFEEMILEVENLSKRIKVITDEITPRIEKRKVELIDPINKRIAEKLEVYRTSKKYKKIFDLGDDKIAEAVLYVDYSFNVTIDFIKYCNEEFEKEKTAK